MRPVLEVRERGAVDEVPAAPCCVRCLKRNGDPEPGSVRSHGNAGTSQRLVLPPLTMAERPDQGTDPSALGSGENGKLCDIRSAAREPAVLLALASQTRDETQRSEDHPADDGVPARVRVFATAYLEFHHS